MGEEIAYKSNCTVRHPIFNFLAEKATFNQLAQAIEAENLCDLHFTEFLAFLLPGIKELPAAEVISNLWDEMGKGDVDRFHKKLRIALMSQVGLPTDERALDTRRFLPEELEHFNAYSATSSQRQLNLRLVGMMMGTELLVPGQLDIVIKGWRRVGLEDSQMQYFLEHVVVDVDHSDGWFDGVVFPIVSEYPSKRIDIAIGMLHHLDILGRLYDSMLLKMTTVP